MVDSHVHTPLCGHAEGSPEEYLFQARKMGLRGLVFTDHSPMPSWYDPGSRMRLGELPFYLLALERVRERNPDLYVGIGLEADYHPGTEAFVAQVVRSYPFDYVLGSVHYLGAWPLDHPDHQEEYAWRDLVESTGPTSRRWNGRRGAASSTPSPTWTSPRSLGTAYRKRPFWSWPSPP
jgi:histidinol-phosphate phosphatase (EC 3.1.3.15)